jgi:hypothetical protein
VRFRQLPDLVLQNEDAGGSHFNDFEDLRTGSESQSASRDIILGVLQEDEITGPEHIYFGHLVPRPQVFEPSGISVVCNPEVDRDLCP